MYEKISSKFKPATLYPLSQKIFHFLWRFPTHIFSIRSTIFVKSVKEQQQKTLQDTIES